MKRLLAIGLVWFGCTAAWMILGGTIVHRTAGATGSILSEVHQLWGPRIRQDPPVVSYGVRPAPGAGATAAPAPAPDDGRRRLPLTASDLKVDLHLEQRRKGLLWFPTYAVRFDGRYAVVNDTGQARALTVTFPLQANATGIDDLSVEDADGKPVANTVSPAGLQWTRTVAAGAREVFRVRYRTRGTRAWTYALTEGTGRVRHFRLVIHTDTRGIDFLAGTLSPSRHGPVPGGWQGTWSFDNLIASSPVGIRLPRRLDPGPVASRITFFAPVGLLFFFFVVAVFAAARRLDLHPLNYVFLGAAFFAFHLLFAYLVDHLGLAASFAIASGVSVFLVVTYARLFVGWRFALREIGIAQLAYLVLFSGTFFWDGYTGLSITVGAVATLFLLMQATGGVRWGELEPPPDHEDAGAVA